MSSDDDLENIINVNNTLQYNDNYTTTNHNIPYFYQNIDDEDDNEDYIIVNNKKKIRGIKLEDQREKGFYIITIPLKELFKKYNFPTNNTIQENLLIFYNQYLKESLNSINIEIKNILSSQKWICYLRFENGTNLIILLRNIEYYNIYICKEFYHTNLNQRLRIDDSEIENQDMNRIETILSTINPFIMREKEHIFVKIPLSNFLRNNMSLTEILQQSLTNPYFTQLFEWLNNYPNGHTYIWCEYKIFIHSTKQHPIEDSHKNKIKWKDSLEKIDEINNKNFLNTYFKHNSYTSQTLST